MSSINYFINSNSAKGFVSFYNSNASSYKNVINLSSYPSAAAEDIIKSIIKRAEAAEIDTEVIHNCLDNTIEGVAIPDLRVFVINNPVYYNESFCVTRLENEPLIEQCNEALNNTYDYFKKALSVHDEWEKIYIDNTDFSKLNILAQQLCDNIIKGVKLEKEGICKDRFFGAATINGPVDYIDNITEKIKKRYFIKGRPGSGKSTLLKAVAKKATESGLDVDVYHCAFDPDSLDMIVIRELDVCIFDSTPPHEHFPTRENDEIIDVYDIAINPETDKNYKTQLENVAVEYKSFVATATKFLNDAYSCCEKINRKYLDRLDYKELLNVKSIILKKCFGE